MHNTSLLEILRTFSHEEIKKFEDFVSSPYHNKKSAVTNLFKHIKKYAPGFTSPRLKKEKVWNALYPGKAFSYGVFKNLIYDLTHLAEKFIALEYHQYYFFHDRYELLDSLLERQVKNVFKSKFKIITDEMENYYNCKNNDAGSYHYYMAKIYLLRWAFSRQHEKNNSSFEELEKHSVYQASAILNLIFHTSINAMNFATDYTYNEKENVVLSFALNADSNNLISKLINSMKPLSAEIYNNLDTYNKYFKSVSDPLSIDKYVDFKKALRLNAKNLSNPDKYILYSGLKNSLRRLASPEINKNKEILDIIKLKIKDKVIFNPDGLLDINEFLSGIDAACDMGDRNFISSLNKRFIDKLPNEAKENMKKYLTAHLYFTENEFEKSLETISTINFDLFIMKYYLKNLQMMNYYEMNEHNSFKLFLDSYKHFLHNNKSITEVWKQEQTLFNSFLSRLFKLKERFNEFELKSLKKEISVSLVHKKQWLLRKVNELEKSIKN